LEKIQFNPVCLLQNAPPDDIDSKLVMWCWPKNLAKGLNIKVEELEEEDGDDDDTKVSKELACIVKKDGTISNQLFDNRAEACATLNYIAACLGHYYPSY
jgi:hypothetical protein